MKHNSIMCEIQNDQIRGTTAAARLQLPEPAWGCLVTAQGRKKRC